MYPNNKKIMKVTYPYVEVTFHFNAIKPTFKKELYSLMRKSDENGIEQIHMLTETDIIERIAIKYRVDQNFIKVDSTTIVYKEEIIK